MKNLFLTVSNRKMSFTVIFLLFSAGLIFNSCKEEKQIDIAFEAYGDMFIQKKMVDNQVVYAPYYYLFANTTMNSASVETPAGESVALEPFEYLTTYINEPGENEFTTSMAELGSYHFTGTYDDDKPFDITDIFDGRVVGFPQIDSLAYDESDYSIYVSWELVGGADIYKVKLANAAGNIIFNGAELTSESNAFKINLDTEGWTITPYTGDVFTLQLHAFTFDGDAGDDDWYYNIECDSYTEAQVVWGE
jgi:hypothetical protein